MSLTRIPLEGSKGLELGYSTLLADEPAHNSEEYITWLLSPELNLVKKVGKTRKETTSQEQEPICMPYIKRPQT